MTSLRILAILVILMAATSWADDDLETAEGRRRIFNHYYYVPYPVYYKSQDYDYKKSDYKTYYPTTYSYSHQYPSYYSHQYPAYYSYSQYPSYSYPQYPSYSSSQSHDSHGYQQSSSY